MASRGYLFRLTVNAIIGSFALLAAPGVGAEDDKAPIVVVVAKPPGECKALGKVTGTSQGNPVNESRARQDALGQAKDLGATHLWYKSEYSGQRGSTGWVYYGVAYRCPAAPAPTPANN